MLLVPRLVSRELVRAPKIELALTSTSGWEIFLKMASMSFCWLRPRSRSPPVQAIDTRSLAKPTASAPFR